MIRTTLIILLMLMAQYSFAQIIKTENSTEEIDSASYSKLRLGYEGLIMAEREELTLFKVDLFGPLLFLFSGDGSDGNPNNNKYNVIGLSVEHKFKPKWSGIVGYRAQSTPHDFVEYRYKGGARYYYNMEKRILQGKSANNFSANYISAFIRHDARPSDNDNQTSFNLVFGIQRRLGKWGYLDFDLGLARIFSAFDDDDDVIGTSSIQIGIAF